LVDHLAKPVLPGAVDVGDRQPRTNREHELPAEGRHNPDPVRGRAEGTQLRDGRQAQTAERKDNTMRNDMTQKGRDAIVEAFVETAFNRLKTKTA
jgi:phage terminase small subunit